MSIRFDAAGDYLSRTTGAIDYNAAYTTAFWVRIVTDTDDFAHFWAASLSTTEVSGDWENSDWIGTNDDGTTLRAAAFVGGSGTASTGTNLTTGTWHHLALVRESTTSLKAYVNGVLDITLTDNISARGAVGAEFVGRFNGGFNLNGRVAGLKQWTRALTAAEILNEINRLLPADASSMHAWHPMFPGATERLADYSGSGRNWTANGTLTDEDPPPVGWGGSPIWFPFTSAAAAAVQPRLLLLGVGF